MSKIKVLYIDDELVNLMAFKASFRRKFEVYTAKSADDGVEILKQHPIEVLISDQRMPHKTGTDFFKSILNEFPNPIRILITAYSDIEAIIDAINKGHVYQYITKPWNNYELQLAIENAHQLYQLKEQNKSLSLKYKKVFSDSTDPIILLNKDLSIVDFNHASSTLLGLENLNNQLFTSFFNDTNKAEEFTTIVTKQELLEDYKCIIKDKNGVKKVCLISGNVITNIYNQFSSYQLVIKDFTKRSISNQQLLEKVIETQENERERIARDLHDSIGQSLAALKLNCNFLISSYQQNNNIENELNKVPPIIESLIAQLRRVCFDTLPLVIQEYGLINAVIDLQSKNTHPDFNIIFNPLENYIPLPKTLEISLFRIIQEFLNNSIKHGNATEINININQNKEEITLSISDNGVGFNIDEVTTFKGYGLKNIKNRVESFNGDLKINSVQNQGTTFNIKIPTIF
ncbi:MAG: response regulator [Vicingaceae bacterium]